jgi:hypothetical protein
MKWRAFAVGLAVVCLAPLCVAPPRRTLRVPPTNLRSSGYRHHQCPATRRYHRHGLGGCHLPELQQHRIRFPKQQLSPSSQLAGSEEQLSDERDILEPLPFSLIC